MKTFFFALTAIVMLLFSSPVFSQTVSPTPPDSEGEKVKISTNLIQVDVTVTDKDENSVTDLKPGDLEIYENGVRQEITNFSFVSRTNENNAPAAIQKSQPINGKITVSAPSVKLRADQVRRTYALVVDDLGLNFGNIFSVKESLKRFINDQMQAGDLVAIVRTGKTNGALSSFTSDKNQLLRVVDKIKWTFQGRSGVSTFENIDTERGQRDLRGSSAGAGANPYDPEVERQMERSRNENFSIGTIGTINQVISGMQELPGRKAVMLFSEGFVLTENRDPRGNQSNTMGGIINDSVAVGYSNRILEAMRRVADLANRASVIIYTIDPRGLQTQMMFEAQDNLRSAEQSSALKMRGDRQIDFMQSQQSLRFLAEETGGLAFVNQNDIDKGLRRAVNDQSSYYLLGYAPDEETFDPNKSKFNKLEVKAVRPGLKLRYRSGFFGVTDEKFSEERKAKENNVAAALSSPFAANDVELNLTSIFANDAKEGNIVRALLSIDAKDLTFADAPNGGKQAEFALYAFAFGENGKILNSLGRTYRVAVNQDDYRRMQEKGFVYFMNVPFKEPGAYQLRVALQDAKTKKIGSATQFIEVPNLKKNRLTLSGLILQTFTNAEWQAQQVAATEANRGQSAQWATATRRFKQGDVLEFSYAVYNAKNLAANKFKSQTRLFRDGQLVFEGKQLPLALAAAAAAGDAGRAQGKGAVALGKEIIPGDYVLQIIVFDETATDKNQIAAQSIDFEVY